MNLVTLDPPALFARLAAGQAAGATVLTPNRRLAQALLRDFARAQAAAGLRSWETPDVLPWGAFVERLWDDLRTSPHGAGLPLLLSPAQEQEAWEQAIDAAKLPLDLLSGGSTAALCAKSWRLAHEWQLADRLHTVARSDDTEAFAQWAERYARTGEARGLIEAARLPERLTPWLQEPALRLPRTLVLHGFDIVTPQVRAFVERLASQGVVLHRSAMAPVPASVRRVAFPSAHEELRAVARWARARLEVNPAARIGIVVPGLEKVREPVRRALTLAMAPGRPANPAAREALPFDISLGRRLADDPVVHDVLLVLELFGREIEFSALSRLIRSPYLDGAELEAAGRSRLDAALRRRIEARTDVDGLLRLLAARDMPRVPGLEARFGAFAQFRRGAVSGSRSPREWARLVTEAMRHLGFGEGRSLDSAEFQALAKWHEVLSSFATLDRVTGRMPFPEAHRRLRRLATETVFQPETPEAPVEVLGILESAGLAFDHLWVLGLTDGAWPMPPRPDPFVPIALQRAAGIPQADAPASLELDRRITRSWLASAGEVVVSHPQFEKDQALLPSPLIEGIALDEALTAGLPAFPGWREAQFAARAVERLPDANGPPMIGAQGAGGTGLFRDQAACPFRAFARHRLASEALEVPAPGLDSRDRGTLLHEALAKAWEQVVDHATLVALTPQALGAHLDAAAAHAVERVRRFRPEALQGRFGELERARLVALLVEWFGVERERAPFAVIERERKIPVTFGGVTVNARIDRIDRLESGGIAVIDYKTGKADVGAWLGPRPDEPQLPMYALGNGEEVAAVAFATVKRGEAAFCGVGSAEKLVPGVKVITAFRSSRAKAYPGWPDLVAGWTQELEALGREAALGEARVAPKDGEDTCKYCDQATFCRIAERA